MKVARLHASASGMATKPVIAEALFMSGHVLLNDMIQALVTLLNFSEKS